MPGLSTDTSESPVALTSTWRKAAGEQEGLHWLRVLWGSAPRGVEAVGRLTGRVTCPLQADMNAVFRLPSFTSTLFRLGAHATARVGLVSILKPLGDTCKDMLSHVSPG